MQSKKKFFTFLLVMTLGVSFLSADNKTNKNPSPKKSQQKYADEPLLSQDACSSLTKEEQNFASQLNDDNALIFCSQMSSTQRQKAMQMAQARGKSSPKISPDDAVQNVIQKDNIQNNNKRPRSGGACPVQ